MPNSSWSRATSVTAVRECQVGTDSTLAARICSSFNSGNTDAKQRSRRLSRLSMDHGLCLMEQGRTLFKKGRAGDANTTAKRGGDHTREEIGYGLVALCLLVVKGNFLKLEILEQPTQGLL